MQAVRWGALDTLLEEYFERDIESGILTEEEAVWMIASLFFNDTHYTQIGGLTPAGDREVTSRLSFLILDAMHLLKIPTNLGIRVHAPIAGQGPEPEILLKRSVEYTIEDGYGVCYSLEKGISEGFSKNGFPVEAGADACQMRLQLGGDPRTGISAAGCNPREHGGCPALWVKGSAGAGNTRPGSALGALHLSFTGDGGMRQGRL